MTSTAFPLRHVVTRDEVPDDGLEVAFDASPEEREALARYLGIPAVTRMSADLTVTRWRRRGLAVRGQVAADVVQTCVVTLEPIDNTVSEEVDLRFSPEAQTVEDVAAGGAAGAEEVEPLVDDRIDLGALACEYLSLGLDPYPRKAGVVFEPGGQDEPKSSPFAGLSALRGGRKDD